MIGLILLLCYRNKWMPIEEAETILESIFLLGMDYYTRVHKMKQYSAIMKEERNNLIGWINDEFDDYQKVVALLVKPYKLKDPVKFECKELDELEQTIKEMEFIEDVGRHKIE